MTQFKHGRGHHKSVQQRHYEKLIEYAQKLEEYVEKIRICGEGRNSYSKTDHSATFMRIKTDYMGNDQLLPAYNVQIGVADEYIAVVDVNQYRTDMKCQCTSDSDGSAMCTCANRPGTVQECRRSSSRRYLYKVS